MGMLLVAYADPVIFVPEYEENYVNDGVSDTYWVFETLVNPTNPRPSYRLQVYWEGINLYNSGAIRPAYLYMYENITAVLKDNYLYCKLDLQEQDSTTLNKYYKIGRANVTTYKRKIFIDIICGNDTDSYSIATDVPAGSDSTHTIQIAYRGAVSQIHYTLHAGSEGSASELPIIYEYTSPALDSESAPISLVITDDPDVTVTIDIDQFTDASYQDATITLTGRNDGSNPFDGSVTPVDSFKYA
ncbi:hypothetical protein [Desulfovibrio sp. An276]|uniref:hypothetical protein n=1 Tax=Desulfovibrio sp. An276 TaxID=1965618 RepID=UPI001184B580|nr:hypothetical protein [Desulfovibrio sp. An276]